MAYYQIAQWLNFVEKPLFAFSHCISACFFLLKKERKEKSQLDNPSLPKDDTCDITVKPNKYIACRTGDLKLHTTPSVKLKLV